MRFQVVGFATAEGDGQGRQDSSNKRQKTSAATLPNRKLHAGNAHLDYRHESFEASGLSHLLAHPHVNKQLHNLSHAADGFCHLGPIIAPVFILY